MGSVPNFRRLQLTLSCGTLHLTSKIMHITGGGNHVLSAVQAQEPVGQHQDSATQAGSGPSFLGYPGINRLVNLAIPLAVLGGLCVYCILFTIDHTADLNTSHLYDSWRDDGASESMLAGEYPHDPLYKGEWNYYNPAIPFLVAVVSQCTGIGVEAVNARMGTYFNIYAPIAFFLLVAALLDRWMALAATVALVLTAVDGQRIGFYFSYIPWLYPAHLGIGLLCLTLALLPGTFKSPRPLRLAGMGLLWGLTFLSHSAPAVSFGIILWLSVLDHILTNRDAGLGRRLLRGAWIGFLPTLVAFIVSLPFTYPLMAHYHFEIKNWEPIFYSDDLLKLNNLPEFLSSCVNYWNLLALYGLIVLLLKPSKSLGHRIILYWLLVAGSLFGCTILRQLCALWHWPFPQFVPSHHFVSQLTTLSVILSAYGVITTLRGPLLLLKKAVLRARHHDYRAARLGTLGLMFPALAFAAGLFHLYHVRYEQWDEPKYGHLWFAHDPYLAQRDLLRIWVRQKAAIDDVFVCQDYYTAQIIMPTGRKATTAFNFYSNPYVDFRERVNAYINVGFAIKNNDAERLRESVRTFHVKWILSDGNDFFATEAPASPLLKKTMSLPPFTIYRIN